MKKADRKRARLDELLTKIKRVGRKLGRISKVKELKKALREEHKTNYELSIEIKRLKHNLNLKENKESAEKSKKSIRKNKYF